MTAIEELPIVCMLLHVAVSEAESGFFYLSSPLVVHMSVRRGTKLQISKKEGSPSRIVQVPIFWLFVNYYDSLLVFIPKIYLLTSTSLPKNLMASLR